MKKEYRVITINKKVRPEELASVDWPEAADAISKNQGDGYKIQDLSTASAVPGLLTLTVVMVKKEPK